MQEDALFPAMGQASELDNLFIVCDGMGGHEQGEVASATVTEAVSEYFFQNTSPEEPLDDRIISEALDYAYDKLVQKVDPLLEKKPGTTLCLLYFHRGGCTAAHIGDSRIYHIRPDEGKILYKSKDHSIVYELYALGEITEEQMLTHPKKNIITKVIMPGVPELKPNIAHIADIRSGDYFYVCSDGMLENMIDKDILAVFSDSNLTNEQKRDLLLEKTKDNADNHSAYIIQIDGVMHEQRDKSIVDDEAKMMKLALPSSFASEGEMESEPEPTTVISRSVSSQQTRPSAVDTSKPYDDEEQTRTSNHHHTHSHSVSSGAAARKHPSVTPRKRSLLIPVITTLVLLGILAFVLLKCRGEKTTLQDNPQVVADTVKQKKPERDTFNIMNGGEAKRSSDMPMPSGEKKADEQKNPEKKEESKSDEPKKTDDSSRPSDETTAAPSAETPTASPTQGQSPTPQPSAGSTAEPTPAPAVTPAPQPTPPAGPKPVIPEDE